MAGDNTLKLFLNAIDGINIWIGRIVGWVIIAVMFITVYDVIARRLLNGSTLWGFDVSVQLFGLHFMIVAAYTLLREEHVSIGIFRDRLSARGKALLDICAYALFFFPFVLLTLYYGWDFAARSWASREVSWGAVALPVYYFKTVIPVTAVLLLLQGTCSIIRLVSIVTGKEVK